MLIRISSGVGTGPTALAAFDAVLVAWPGDPYVRLNRANALLALQRDQGVPLLALSFDEHTARAGLLTRLEAFVDLLARRPDRQPTGHTWQGWTILPSFGARRDKEQP